MKQVPWRSRSQPGGAWRAEPLHRELPPNSPNRPRKEGGPPGGGSSPQECAPAGRMCRRTDLVTGITEASGMRPVTQAVPGPGPGPDRGAPSRPSAAMAGAGELGTSLLPSPSGGRLHVCQRKRRRGRRTTGAADVTACLWRKQLVWVLLAGSRAHSQVLAESPGDGQPQCPGSAFPQLGACCCGFVEGGGGWGLEIL